MKWNPSDNCNGAPIGALCEFEDGFIAFWNGSNWEKVVYPDGSFMKSDDVCLDPIPVHREFGSMLSDDEMETVFDQLEKLQAENNALKTTLQSYEQLGEVREINSVFDTLTSFFQSLPDGEGPMWERMRNKGWKLLAVHPSIYSIFHEEMKAHGKEYDLELIEDELVSIWYQTGE